MTDLAQAYRRDGYVFPFRAMSGTQAAGYRALLEAAESRYPAHARERVLLAKRPMFLLPCVSEIMRLPTILDKVKAVLGPDLLVWGASFFIKEPMSPHYVSWHQDLTYWGLDDVAEVTAWIALSPATRESGCMRFIAGSHTNEIVPHRDTFAEQNMLTRGQALADEVDETNAVDVVLRPGEFSLHHGRLFHGSRPNGSDVRRIGLAIRYISPDMRQVSGQKGYAQIAAGEDRHGHFHICEPPRETLAPKDLELVDKVLAHEENILYAGAAERGHRVS